MQRKVRISRGLQWRWLDTWGLRYTMTDGVIEVYDGAIPQTPDLAPTGRLLGVVTSRGLPFVAGQRSGGALALIQPYIGQLVGDMSQGPWFLTPTATGTATWWRMHWNGPDPNTDDPLGNYPRIDGEVGDSLLLATNTLVAGQAKAVAGFYLQFD